MKMNFKSKHVSITRRNEDTYHSVLSTDRSIKLLAEKTVDVSFWTMPAKVQKKGFKFRHQGFINSIIKHALLMNLMQKCKVKHMWWKLKAMWYILKMLLRHFLCPNILLSSNLPRKTDGLILVNNFFSNHRVFIREWNSENVKPKPLESLRLRLYVR